MKIINGEVIVRSSCRLGDIELVGCNVICDFPLFSDNYEPAKLFEFREAFDGNSEDFKVVFENTSMRGCTIKGTDCA